MDVIVCTSCGAEAEEGHLLCATHLKSIRESQRALRARRRAAGLCYRCETPSAPGKAMCTAHLEMVRRQNEKNSAIRRGLAVGVRGCQGCAKARIARGPRARCRSHEAYIAKRIREQRGRAGRRCERPGCHCLIPPRRKKFCSPECRYAIRLEKQNARDRRKRRRRLKIPVIVICKWCATEVSMRFSRRSVHLFYCSWNCRKLQEREVYRLEQLNKGRVIRQRRTKFAVTTEAA